jgi:amino acid transporter
MPTCIFAMAGSENAGLVAAETKNPRRSVPKAVASIWIRLSLFYILGSLIITINVSPLNEDIFGGTGTNASPFVIMYRQAGVQPLAHMMNAVIFISVLSTGTISGFAGSRTLLGLSQIGMAPKVRRRFLITRLQSLTWSLSSKCKRPTRWADPGTVSFRPCSSAAA